MKLIDYKITDFNEKLASGSATPGGGSVAGLSASLSAGLISMVVNLTKGEELNQYGEKAGELRKQAEELIDKDTESFNKVMAAFKMPKDTDEDKEKRKAAIQAALEQASLTPLQTMKLSLQLLKGGCEVIKNCNPNTISDIGVAGQMGLAAIRGAYYNVMINACSLTDEKTASRLKEEADAILKEGEELAAEISRITMSNFE